MRSVISTVCVGPFKNITIPFPAGPPNDMSSILSGRSKAGNSVVFAWSDGRSKIQRHGVSINDGFLLKLFCSAEAVTLVFAHKKSRTISFDHPALAHISA